MQGSWLAEAASAKHPQSEAQGTSRHRLFQRDDSPKKGVLMAHDEAYYEAEKKIEEALKSGTTKLDLGLPELGFPAAPEGRPDPIIWGSLVAVMNKHQEFFWVHEKFASEY